MCILISVYCVFMLWFDGFMDIGINISNLIIESLNIKIN